MKIFQLIDMIIRLFRLNKKSKVVLLFLIPTFLIGQNNAAFWLGKRAAETGETDPFFSSVSLLLHMDGANGSTTFTDNSNNNFTPTVFGNAQISTAQSKFGGASGFFDGNGDYLRVTGIADWLGKTGNDFTIEFWVRASVFATLGAGLVSIGNSLQTNNNSILAIDLRSDGIKATVTGAYTSYNLVTTALSLNTWYHVALTRSGNDFRLYLNGLQQGSTFTNATNLITTSYLYVGSNFYDPGNLARSLNGYIDDLRITKGVARYTSNFTPPTAPFPNN